MSDEMAVSDNVASDQPQVKNEDASGDGDGSDTKLPVEQPTEALTSKTEDALISIEGTPVQNANENLLKSGESSIKKTTDEKTETKAQNDIQNIKEESEKLEKLEETLPVKLENLEENMDTDEKSIEEEMDIAKVKESTDSTVVKEPQPETKEVKEEVLEKDRGQEESIEEIENLINRGIKRRASEALSDGNEDFKGFDILPQNDITEEYSRILERLEEEVSAANKDFKPLRRVIVGSSNVLHASKRSRKDTDGSRPSSAMSSRSDEANDAASPMQRGRRATTEMTSPLLRVPLERGWKRELVYRAALDSYSRRHADIYYYMPSGKKLRSTREVADHLSGTGLTLENFSFFKEPLGVDDPDKEIIRDAKFIRKVESPVAAASPTATIEGKRTPKPKQPKGASPEPSTPKAQPAKIKVKSVGSRLSGSAAGPAPATAQKQPRRQQQPTTALTQNNTDNNNTSSWKKPRAPETLALHPAVATQRRSPPSAPALPPPSLLSRQPPLKTTQEPQTRHRLVQPCSMSCGRGAVPSLSCAACLCLYHPACAGYLHAAAPQPFLCANCSKSSPTVDSPQLLHKSTISGAGANLPVPGARKSLCAPSVASAAALASAPAKVPPRPDKRVLLRMKVAGGTEGERVWSVSSPCTSPIRASPPTSPAFVPQPTPPQSLPTAPTVAGTGHVRGTGAGHTRGVASGGARGMLPQFLALFNGRRFIVVPRTILHTAQNHDDKRRGRIANGGASSPPAVASALPTAVTAPAGAICPSPRRRGRPKLDDTDYFTAFYNRASKSNYNVVVQIFQFLGMRELAQCTRVCRLWRQLAATPALWRHVRMKNSHVSSWAGLCSALRKHGTKRLDLRKMLLPQNDALFWSQFAENICNVNTLERIEMCRCPSNAVEAVCVGLPGLISLNALAIRDALLDPAPLGTLTQLHELRLKSMAGLSLTRDLAPLGSLTKLQHLSLTSIKDLGWCACEVVGTLSSLESLELGECSFRADMGSSLARLTQLRRVRLERGPAHHAAPPVLRALASLPALVSLELINVDVKIGFDDALAECKNIQRLLIIPTYVSQSATTNKQVLSGVLRLKETLTHLMWGVTIELLRVTELFIDQCEQAGDAKRRDVGECIPVLKPVPGCKLPEEHHHVAGPPQVEILPLPTLQRLLSAQMPNTKLKLLRIPFHATWRQSLADFQ